MGERKQVHRFDAGTMGCAEGLNGEFKKRLEAIPVGDLLEVTARDPVAKDDLPAFARLLGHEVRSVGLAEDRSIVIVVERMGEDG